MRQQSCIDLTLEHLVKLINGGKFAIPYFQRDNVWNPVQVGNLSDSICRGRPIDSITLIPREGKLQIGTRPLDVKGAVLVSDFDYHVLDGQQRLTAIAKTFGNFPDEIPYYFDLFSILVQEFEDDNILLKNPEASLYYKYDVEDSVCIRIKEAKGKPATWGNGRFILCREFLEGRGLSHIMNFMQTLELDSDSDKFGNYMNTLVALHNIGNYPVLTNQIYEDTPEEEIVAMFLSINQSGVELELGDLINAQSFKYQQMPNGLASVFEKDIMSALKKHKGLTGAFKKMGYKGKEFNIIPILNTLYFYKILLDGYTFSDKVPSKEELFSFGAQNFFDLWSPPQKFAFFQALEWVTDNKWDKFMTPLMLQWFTAFCMAEPKILEYPSLLKRFKYLLIHCNQMRLIRVNSIRSKIHDLMSAYIQTFKNALNTPFPDKSNHFPTIQNPIQFSPDTILQTVKGLSGSFMLLDHLLLDESGVYFTMDWDGNPVDKTQDVKREYLFNYEKETNIKGLKSWANMVLVCPDENGIIHNERIPFDMRMQNALNKLGKEKFDEMCRINMIDYDAYCQDRNLGMSEIEAATQMLYRRAIKMTHQVNQYFQNGSTL